MAENQWFVKTKNGEAGPFSAAQLRDFANQGKIKPNTPIRRGDMQQWVAAEKIKGLFNTGNGEKKPIARRTEPPRRVAVPPTRPPEPPQVAVAVQVRDPEPSPQPTQYISQQVVVAGSPSNGLGVAGFIVSLCGLLFTCGLICPIGFLLSLFALFKPPRGFAIAGSVIGGLGSLWMVFFGFGMLLAMVGAGEAVNSAREAARVSITKTEIRAAEEQMRNGNHDISDMKDGWETPLRFDPARNIVISAGPDQVFGTEDDIDSTDAEIVNYGTSP